MRIAKAEIYAGYTFIDYHFMKETSSGMWAHKPGLDNSEIKTYSDNPDDLDMWKRGYADEVQLYYEYGPIYFTLNT